MDTQHEHDFYAGVVIVVVVSSYVGVARTIYRCGCVDFSAMACQPSDAAMLVHIGVAS